MSSSMSSLGAPTVPSTSETVRIVQCPDCKIDVLRLVSKSVRNPGRIFFKCPNFRRPQLPTCSFFMWEEDYKQYLDDIGVQTVGNGSSEGEMHINGSQGQVVGNGSSEGEMHINGSQGQVGVSTIEARIEKFINELKNERGRLVEYLVVINTILLISILFLLLVMIVLVVLK